jgi:hypothetical protein
MAPETESVDAPLFAGGPPPDACDVKGLPVRDYFADKDTIKKVSDLLRELADACVSLSASTESIGFDILSSVEVGRRIGGTTVYEAGGDIVAGVWGAMEYVGFACDNCNTDGPTVEQAIAALGPGGAFGVRTGGDTQPVFSMGDPSIERWGVVPEGGDWSAVIPTGSILVYGSPVFANPLVMGDEPLGGGFDWKVTPWYTDPWEENLTYLLVGTCAEANQTALISHVRKISDTEEVEALLPQGPPPAYCSEPDPLLAAGLFERVTKLAYAALPFWPQPLNAAFAAGVSGSGKAREFSPFYGYDTSPDAKVVISEPPAEPTPVGQEIFSPFRASWTTQGDSPLATWETVVIYTRDNNGATVDFGSDFKSTSGAVCTLDARNRIKCECDAREGIQNCVGIEIEDLTLNKPGGYELCIEGEPNDYSSGLNIYACTGTFHISPN